MTLKSAIIQLEYIAYALRYARQLCDCVDSRNTYYLFDAEKRLEMVIRKLKAEDVSSK